jgi:hypothetical protein
VKLKKKPNVKLRKKPNVKLKKKPNVNLRNSARIIVILNYKLVNMDRDLYLYLIHHISLIYIVMISMPTV